MFTFGFDKLWGFPSFVSKVFKMFQYESRRFEIHPEICDFEKVKIRLIQIWRHSKHGVISHIIEWPPNFSQPSAAPRARGRNCSKIWTTWFQGFVWQNIADSAHGPAIRPYGLPLQIYKCLKSNFFSHFFFDSTAYPGSEYFTRQLFFFKAHWLC